jgi:putative ABC transport system permease protein
MAREYWPNADPLGGRLHLQPGALAGSTDAAQSVLTVVGVVSDVKQIRVIDAPVRQEFYLAQPQFAGAGRTLTMMVRSSMPPASLTRAIRLAVSSVDPELPVYNVQPMDQIVADSFGPKRIATVLLAFFALVTLILSAVGAYAIVSYSVTQRMGEIGIRIALGARPGQAVQLVMREGCVLAFAGFGLGLGLTLLASRLAQQIQYGISPVGLLYGVSELAPWALLGVGALLFAVVLAACYFPARRATRVDPMMALRST